MRTSSSSRTISMKGFMKPKSLLLLIAAAGLARTAAAEDADLAKQLSNPVASLISVPLPAAAVPGRLCSRRDRSRPSLYESREAIVDQGH